MWTGLVEEWQVHFSVWLFKYSLVLHACALQWQTEACSEKALVSLQLGAHRSDGMVMTAKLRRNGIDVELSTYMIVTANILYM